MTRVFHMVQTTDTVTNNVALVVQVRRSIYLNIECYKMDLCYMEFPVYNLHLTFNVSSCTVKYLTLSEPTFQVCPPPCASLALSFSAASAHCALAPVAT